MRPMGKSSVSMQQCVTMVVGWSLLLFQGMGVSVAANDDGTQRESSSEPTVQLTNGPDGSGKLGVKIGTQVVA